MPSPNKGGLFVGISEALPRLTGRLTTILLLVLVAVIAAVALSLWAGTAGVWISLLLLLIVVGAIGVVQFVLPARVETENGAEYKDAYWLPAVTTALVVASVVAHLAAQDAVRAIAQSTHVLFVEAPGMLSSQCGMDPATAIETALGRISGDTEPLNCLNQRGGAHAKAAQNAQADEAPAPDSKGDGYSYEAGVGDWVVFAIAFAATLVLFRNVTLSRRAYLARLTHAGPPGTSKSTIMDYPTWVAFLIYLALLLPAAYFAIGSLLYLRTDAPQANVTSFANTLSEAEQHASNPAPPPDIDVASLGVAATQYYATTAKSVSNPARPNASVIVTAIKNGQATVQDMIDGPDRFRESAILEVVKASKRISGAELDDYKGLITAQYTADLQAARGRGSDCVQALESLQKSLVNLQSASQRPSPPAQTTPGVQGSQPEAPIASNAAQVADVDRDLHGLSTGCAQATSFGQPMIFTQFDQDSGTPLGRMYQWLGQSSESTVLIIGLVGFGLFGAAIRMMGRPDIVKDGEAPNPKKDGRSEEVERRNTMVAPRSGGGFEVTGAPVRVLVQGVGAAFTVFLGGQAGSFLLTSGNHPNAYSLLLMCFIGAVFAEEIWGWAQRLTRADARREHK